MKGGIELAEKGRILKNIYSNIKKSEAEKKIKEM
jgi:hypothetical protein